MYDPKFEKAIQQKMEELEFHPAESVWVNIEKSVVADRRRRGAGFFWWFLLPGLFLVGGAGAYFYHSAGKPSIKAVQIVGEPAGTQSVKAAKTTEATPVETGSTTAARHNETMAKIGTVRPATTRRLLPRAAGIAGKAIGNSQSDGNSMSGRRSRNSGAGVSGGANENSGTSGTSSLQQDRVGAASDNIQDRTASNHVPALAAATSAERSDWFYMPGLADQRLSPQVHGTALTTKKNTISLVDLSQKKSHWEAGFAGGAGWSRLNRLNADGAAAAVAPMAQSLYNISASSSSKHYVSDMRPGASFDAGIYLQRPLSRRWILNTGMNLHYYSSTISVGQQLNTYVNASASFFTPTVATTSQNSTMYAAGNQRSYTNRYYFLELPVGVQWQISQNHILPIFVEGGGSLSRLMGADALFYNPQTGLYSKDGDVVNKTQFNLSSAILFGLPFHGLRIQLGPQVQYGLTPLVNTHGLGDQHFLYTGLRIVVIPGKK